MYSANGIATAKPDIGLITASIIFIKQPLMLYKNYMELGLLVYSYVEDINQYKNYCSIESGADVCQCGNIISYNAPIKNLRFHCPTCCGGAKRQFNKQQVDLQYTIYVLCTNLGIHYSWLEYSFIEAIWRCAPRKDIIVPGRVLPDTFCA